MYRSRPSRSLLALGATALLGLTWPLSAAHALGETETETRTLTAADADAWFDASGDLVLSRMLGSLEADAREYIHHVTTLANPFFEGRAPGTNGNQVAADYLEFWFKTYGLEPAFPAADGGSAEWTSYRQPFEHGGTVEAGESAFAVETADGELSFELGTDFSVLGVGEGEIEGPLSFVGYAIAEGPDGFEAYDSFDGADLTDRIAVVLRFEPSDDQGLSRFTGEEDWSNRADLVRKFREVTRRGAKGIVLVSPPDIFDARGDELIDTAGSNWGRFEVPVINLSRDAADRLFKALDGRSLADMKRLADADDATTIHLGENTATLATKLDRHPIRTDNVGGVLRGKGDLADQWVIIGGHYDHVGYGYFGSRGGSAGTIHPGADDNASGTAGVLMLAKRIAQRYAELPDDASARSILFMGFTAEESGLHGSRYFAQHPTVDLEDVQIMINLDMIGRLRDNMVEASGIGTAEGLADIVKPHFDSSGLQVTSQQTGTGPSDHASFYAAGVPVMFFFTGLHDDYHSPSDQFWTVNPLGTMRILDLVETVALDMATRADKLVYTTTSGRMDINALQRAREGQADDGPVRTRQPRVRLGIRPSYREGTEGVLVDGVTENTAAAEGGVQAGDVITSWNGEPMTDVGTLFRLLLEHKPGDKVTLGVLRGEESIELTLTLKENDANVQD